jgi:hypothetical protein
MLDKSLKPSEATLQASALGSFYKERRSPYYFLLRNVVRWTGHRQICENQTQSSLLDPIAFPSPRSPHYDINSKFKGWKGGREEVQWSAMEETRK